MGSDQTSGSTGIEPSPPATLNPDTGDDSIDRDLFGRPPRHHPDWSHRRGEPRVFALGWTVYLMMLTTLMFAWAGGRGIMSPESFRVSARLTMVLLLVGITLLWPMTRLSQAAPQRPLPSTLKDLLIIALPAQALIWPHIWLCRWPVEVVAAAAAAVAIWAVAIGAILAIAWGFFGVGNTGRILAMAACVILVVSGAVVALVDASLAAGRTPPLAQLPWMYTPLTSIFELTRDRPWSGRSADIGPGHLRALVVIGALSVGGWAVAAMLPGCRFKR